MLRFRARPLILLALVPALALAACGGDDAEPTAERTATASSGSATTAAATTAAPAGNAPIEQLIATEAPGFTRSDTTTTAGGAVVTYRSNTKTAGGANATVLITYATCDPFICRKLDPKEYDTPAKQMNLKLDLARVHIDNPALVFEFAPVTLAPGRSGLSTFALSYVETTDASGTSRAGALQYKAWYHDGVTFMTLQVFPRDGESPRSVQDLAKQMTKAEGEATAKAVFAAIVPLLK